jgi:hypothetical protein
MFSASRSGTSRRRRRGGQLHHGQHGRARGHVFAQVRPPLLHRPRERRAKARVRELLLGQGQVAAALGQDAAPVVDLLQRVVVHALRHLERGLGGVELGLGEDALLVQLARAGQVDRGLVQAGPGLADDADRLRVHVVVVAGHGQAQPGARLLQRRPRAVTAQLVVARVELRQHGAGRHPAAEVHVPALEPARHLEPEVRAVLRGQRAHRDHGARHPALLGPHELHAARRLFRRARGRVPGAAEGRHGQHGGRRGPRERTVQSCLALPCPTAS